LNVAFISTPDSSLANPPVLSKILLKLIELLEPRTFPSTESTITMPSPLSCKLEI